MTKETFTVPAFEVTIESDRAGVYVIDGEPYTLADIKREAGLVSAVDRAVFTAALAYLDANKPDPRPGFTVRHEVDGEWKWTAVFCPLKEGSATSKWPWQVTENNGRLGSYSREGFAALCERDGVTL